MAQIGSISAALPHADAIHAALAAAQRERATLLAAIGTLRQHGGTALLVRATLSVSLSSFFYHCLCLTLFRLSLCVCVQRRILRLIRLDVATHRRCCSSLPLCNRLMRAVLPIIVLVLRICARWCALLLAVSVRCSALRSALAASAGSMCGRRAWRPCDSHGVPTRRVVSDQRCVVGKVGGRRGAHRRLAALERVRNAPAAQSTSALLRVLVRAARGTLCVAHRRRRHGRCQRSSN